jgi:flagellar protein FliT
MSLPPDASALLRHYAALERASREMLEAARAGDWDSVCRQEGACAVVIARLREQTERQQLPREEQRERMRILREIVARDAEIRRICDPLPALMDGRAYPFPPPQDTLH